MQHDDANDEPDDDLDEREHRLRPVPSRPRSSPTATRPRAEPRSFAQYTDEADLYRTEPMVYAMAVVRQTYDRVVDTFERSLFTSFDRLDRTLESQHAHGEFINSAMQTVTRGAGEIAGLGLDLFRTGLEHQTDVSRSEHESESDKERSELMRDAVQQGSQLAQAVVMSNAIKRRSSPGATGQPDAPRSRAATPSPVQPQAATSADEPADADTKILTRIQALLEGTGVEVIEGLRPKAPTIVGILDQLRANTLGVPALRQLVQGGDEAVPQKEMLAVAVSLEPELRDQFAKLIAILKGQMEP